MLGGPNVFGKGRRTRVDGSKCHATRINRFAWSPQRHRRAPAVSYRAGDRDPKLNPQTVRNWIGRGTLPAYRVGRRVRIRRLISSSFSMLRALSRKSPRVQATATATATATAGAAQSLRRCRRRAVLSPRHAWDIGPEQRSRGPLLGSREFPVPGKVPPPRTRGALLGQRPSAASPQPAWSPLKHTCAKIRSPTNAEGDGDRARIWNRLSHGTPDFGSLALAYDSDEDRVQCHLCGRWLKMVGGSHIRWHGWTLEGYRAAFQLRGNVPTCSVGLSGRLRRSAEVRIGREVSRRHPLELGRSGRPRVGDRWRAFTRAW